jgi:hypothetical protein
VSTADNGASYEDNGIGLYRRKTTAAAEIDDDAIGGSISLVRGSKQQSTDDRGEETTTAIQRPMGDGGGGIQQSALILGGGGRWSGLDRVLSLGGGEGLSRGTGVYSWAGKGQETRELIVTKIHRPRVRVEVAPQRKK